ncbi:hypothetical protein PINS_up001775 [Pythium insidiosum]|nr:hypothetical protein PINS_up001775 [Pythium insidiosum]
MGSDHCPVRCKLIVQLSDPSTVKSASLCAKFFTEFAGKQQTIKAFLSTSSDTPPHPFTTISSNPVNGRNTTPKPRGQQSITAFFGSQQSRKQPKTPPKVSTAQPLGATSEPIDPVFAHLKRQLADAEQDKWKAVLSGQAPKTPMCHCGQPTVMRSVLKTNENWGRKFYVCTRPAGEKGHPDARCEFFQWADQRGSQNKKQKR